MGTLLVAVQFTLLLLLVVYATPPIWVGGFGSIPATAYLLGGASVVLGVWTLAHNRFGNFNIRPVPKPAGILVTTGPYRWIRHPMYTSLLFGAGALAWTSRPITAWVLWSVLTFVLYAKARLEENGMRDLHADYAAYMARTTRFIPWLV